MMCFLACDFHGCLHFNFTVTERFPYCALIPFTFKIGWAHTMPQTPVFQNSKQSYPLSCEANLKWQ